MLLLIGGPAAVSYYLRWLAVRVRLYVDGFNLYYRLLKRNAGTKWLDLNALGNRLFPSDEIIGIRYFTALIKPLNDPRAPARQQVYLRALGALPNCTIQWLLSGSSGMDVGRLGWWTTPIAVGSGLVGWLVGGGVTRTGRF